MIYLDNAATTYPKPFSVLETVYRANRKYAYNSGRGGYRESVQTAERSLPCGTAWAAFFIARSRILCLPTIARLQLIRH